MISETAPMNPKDSFGALNSKICFGRIQKDDFSSSVRSYLNIGFVDKKNWSRDIYKLQRTFLLFGGRGSDNPSHMLDENLRSISILKLDFLMDTMSKVIICYTSEVFWDIMGNLNLEKDYEKIFKENANI